MQKQLPTSPFLRTIRVAALLPAAILLMWVAAASPATADEVSLPTARKVAGNFLRHVVRTYGSWAGSAHPEITAMEIVQEGDEVVGYNFLVSPSGHVLVPAEDDLPPIKMYSEKSTLSLGTRVDEHGIPVDVPHEAQDKAAKTTEIERKWLSSPLLKAKQAGREKREQTEAPAVPPPPEIKPGLDYAAPGWELFTMDEEEFEAAHDKALEDFPLDGDTSAPLMTTSWAQGMPDSGDLYNRFTPLHSSGCRTLTGCTATALAQIMRHHGRPIRGRGNVTYTWFDGVADQTLSRDFSLAGLDWDNMPDALLTNSTDAQKNAVARLMADLGFALKTDYGCFASGAALPEAVTVLKDHYRYKDSMLVLNRSDYGSADAWIDVFKDEISAGRPALLRIQESGGMGHSAAVDGYREFPSKTLHINMGWGANYNGWYVPDDFSAMGYNWNNSGYQAAIIGITPPDRGNLTLVSPKGDTLLYRDRGPFVFLDETGLGYQWFHIRVESADTTAYNGWAKASDACASGDCAVTLPPHTVKTPGNYSWKVMGWKKDDEGSGYINGSWSPSATFTAAVPLPVSLVAPIGNLSESNSTPSMVWNKTAGPSWYKVALKDKNGKRITWADGPDNGWYPAEGLCDTDPVTCTLPWGRMTENSSAALESGSYSWTVSAWGIGLMNEVRGRFYIEGPTPKNPDILAPLPPEESGENETSPAPNLVWEDTGADWYCFWLKNPKTKWGRTCWNNSGCADGNCSEPLKAYHNGNYSVWGQGWKKTGSEWKSSGWSDSSFLLQVPPTRPPSNMTPGNGSMIDGFKTTLRWTTCGNSTWQNILILTAANEVLGNASGAWVESRKYCTDVSNGTCALNTTMFAPDGLRGGIYKWRVRGWNPSGLSEFDTSLDAFFSVDPYPASKTNLVSPVNGTQVSGTLTLVWNKTNAYWQHVHVIDSSNESKVDKWYGPDAVNCSSGACSLSPADFPPIPGTYRWRIGTWNPNNGKDVVRSDWANFTL